MTAQVVSPDGTRIGFERAGDGPPLLLVHGSADGKEAWDKARDALAEHFTLLLMDRRGRGLSPDLGHPFSLQREGEDIAAVADAVGMPIMVAAHSYGAFCTLAAMGVTDSIERAVLYEPLVYWGGEAYFAEGAIERLMEMDPADEDPDELMWAFYKEAVGLPDHLYDALRSDPAWEKGKAHLPTCAREAAVARYDRLDAEDLAHYEQPIRLLLGELSHDKYRRSLQGLDDALPHAELVVLPGQSHLALDAAPDLVVEQILSFAGERQ